MSGSSLRIAISLLIIQILLVTPPFAVIFASAEEGDIDNDQMDDFWEEYYGLDPEDPSDADLDADSDGVTNREEHFEETDPTDPSSHPHEINEDNYDPSSETPTDTSIQVEITEAQVSLIESNNKVNVDTIVRGTTNGVDHCIYAQITYFSTGLFEDIVDWDEAFSWDKSPWQKDWMMEVGYNSWHFKETSDDWATWEYKVSITMNITDYWYTEFMKYGPERVLIYVRAFDDVGDTKWNQASKEVKIKTDNDDKDDTKKDGDNGGFLPGFDSTVIILSFVFLLFITTSRRRKR